eukprot:9468862-Pyramimonas_sp.AAC.1
MVGSRPTIINTYESSLALSGDHGHHIVVAPGITRVGMRKPFVVKMSAERSTPPPNPLSPPLTLASPPLASPPLDPRPAPPDPPASSVPSAAPPDALPS